MAPSTAFSCRKFCDVAQKAIHIEPFVVSESQPVQMVPHVTPLARSGISVADVETYQTWKSDKSIPTKRMFPIIFGKMTRLTLIRTKKASIIAMRRTVQ